MGTDSIARNGSNGKSRSKHYHVDPAGYGVSEEIESVIRIQAWKIGSEHGDYGEIDDLAQEGRIAAWKVVQEHGPRADYCLNHSRQAMAQYARHGLSVDTRMWANFRRKRRYGIEDLDAPLTSGSAPEDATLGDLLTDPRPSPESRALSRIVLSDIEGLLTDQELEVARLKAAGYSYTEMVRQGLFSRWEAECLSRSIRKKLAWYYDRADLHPDPRIREQPERFRWEPSED